MITAPYNFVPLNKEVFYPSWADSISHDIPFEDGESAEIELEIEAKSPIFVRDSKQENEFCNYKGQYYIPGSSIKGVLREILEIITFSKMRLQDKRLSYRDLNNYAYKKNAMNQNRIYMGWLYKDGDSWKIDSLGKVTASKTRIKYQEMAHFLGFDVVNKIKREKEAYKKYRHIKDFDQLNIPTGTIVFTGSTGNKTREFLFPKKVQRTIVLNDKKLIETFKDAYYIGTPNESKDWKELWSKRFKDGKKIPVFFQMDNSNILHFGLSMLYKLPYRNSIGDLLKRYQDIKDDLDMAESIFGYVKDKKALKGRVNITHFKSKSATKYPKNVVLPLSTPRATFYPNYLVQCKPKNKTDRHITYDDDNAILRGHKLYPHRKNVIISDEICAKNKNVCTSFKPLDKGSVFEGKVRFHNLKDEEIGALLAAITFFEKDECFHKVGMAKAYGFGSVKIKIKNNTLNKDISYYIARFKERFEKDMDTSLIDHPRIKALFELSSYVKDEKKLRFMKIKDFVNSKKHFNSWVLDEVVENGYDKTKLCQAKKKKNFQNNQNRHKNFKNNRSKSHSR